MVVLSPVGRQHLTANSKKALNNVLWVCRAYSVFSVIPALKVCAV